MNGIPVDLDLLWVAYYYNAWQNSAANLIVLQAIFQA
jgi:hypothetical protein